MLHSRCFWAFGFVCQILIYGYLARQLRPMRTCRLIRISGGMLAVHLELERHCCAQAANDANEQAAKAPAQSGRRARSRAHLAISWPIRGGGIAGGATTAHRATRLSKIALPLQAAAESASIGTDTAASILHWPGICGQRAKAVYLSRLNDRRLFGSTHQGAPHCPEERRRPCLCAWASLYSPPGRAPETSAWTARPSAGCARGSPPDRRFAPAGDVSSAFYASSPSKALRARVR